MSEIAQASRVPEGIEASPSVVAMFERYGSRYVWFAVSTAMMGSFATLLTGTIINVAIPEVMGAFGIGQDQAQWLSTAFLAAGTVTMLLSAWCVEAFGMRYTYVGSMLVFLLGSVIGASAPNPEVLIISRLIQGAASGVIGPMSMVINYQIFPVRRRGMAMGIFGIGVVLAPALGPTLGGILIDNYDWRYVFLLAIPFSIVSVPFAMMFMPEREGDGPIPRFDWTGMVLSSIFLTAMLTALTNGQREGWDSDYIVGLAGLAVITLTLFIWWEARVERPMLNLRLFEHPRFLAAAIVTLVVGVGLYGSTYILPLFLQTLQGITPTDSGLLMLPAGLAMAACFPLAGTLSDRVEPRWVICTGLLLFGVSNFLMRVVDVNTPYALILGWALIGRVGLALVFPSLNAASLASLPLHLLAQGSGAINFLRQLGGAMGVNLLSIFLAERGAEFSAQFTATQASLPATLGMMHQLQDAVFGVHLDYLLEFEMTYGFVGRAIYMQSLTKAFDEGFIVVAVVFFVSMVPTLMMKSDRR
ncbi:MAG: DHA2 family efflux MFS transporter permease subunit [Pseudomonadales bacterium]|nr:DHA2 family efflux MFS transporter permease subunit [Pseudomonadales bacterium]